MGDGSQAITEAGIYDAYGNILVSSGSLPSFGYDGQYRYFADVTGLNCVGISTVQLFRVD